MAEWQLEILKNIHPMETIFASLGEPGETSEKYLGHPQPGGPSWPAVQPPVSLPTRD